LNNVIEQDHRRIKQRIWPMLGFKRFETAAVRVRGIELAEKIKKQQFNLKPLTGKSNQRSGHLGRCPVRLESEKSPRQTLCRLGVVHYLIVSADGDRGQKTDDSCDND
jgi:hypothetical protein